MVIVFERLSSLLVCFFTYDKQKTGLNCSSNWAARGHKSDICTHSNKYITTDACVVRNLITLDSEKRCECYNTNQGLQQAVLGRMHLESAYTLKLAASMLLSEAMSIFDWSPASAFYFLQGATLLVLCPPRSPRVR